MKIIAIALLVFSFLPSFSQNQFFVIKAGAAYSKLDGISSDFGDAIGYYVGFGVQERLDKVLGFGFDINYLNQRAGVEGISFAVRSINANLNYHFYTSDVFYFMAGLESGMVSSIKVEDEASPGDLEYRFGYVLGLSYVLNDLFDLQARYIGPFDHKQAGFDFNVQVGLACRLPAKN